VEAGFGSVSTGSPRSGHEVMHRSWTAGFGRR
jgi:hypothetical protein